MKNHMLKMPADQKEGELSRRDFIAMAGVAAASFACALDAFAEGAEENIRLVHELGFTNCFL